MSALRSFARGGVYGLTFTSVQCAILGLESASSVLTALSVFWLALAFLLDLLTRKSPADSSNEGRAAA